MNKVGHSFATPDKEKGLDAILRQHLSIVKAIFFKHPWPNQKYYYYDICCGDGKNEAENCEGSPIIFLKIVNGLKLPFEAYFIDKNPLCTTRLSTITKSFGNDHFILTSDNNPLLCDLLKRLPNPKYNLGMIYSDPNGISDFALLSEASKYADRIDILLRYPASAAKRNGKRLDDLLVEIKKAHWLVRKPLTSDKWQATLLFGTNYLDYKAWKAHRFYPTNSPEGLDIFKRLNFTNKELDEMNQLKLWENTPRQKAIHRSKNICELCDERKVTEVHHLSYRPIESPDDLIAICHECHCIQHGKED